MYHVAISMTSETHNPQQVESNSINDNLGDNDSESDTDDRDEVLDEDETDSKVNFAAKKVRSPKSPKISQNKDIEVSGQNSKPSSLTSKLSFTLRK